MLAEPTTVASRYEELHPVCHIFPSALPRSVGVIANASRLSAMWRTDWDSVDLIQFLANKFQRERPKLHNTNKPNA
jgi:hypothetical protein